MKILVTGSTGFIGREVALFLSKKYDTFALVREKSDISKIELTGLTVLKYSEYSELLDIFKHYKFDGIIHAASSVVINHTKDQINTLVDSNILFGMHLLEASKLSNVKWFLNTGTFWQHYKDQDYNPVNLYAATKQAFENIAKFYADTSNLVFTTIKLNDTFGPNDTRKKIFNLWLESLENNKTLDMSEGNQVIDISYIEDIVFAYSIMIENLKDSNAAQFNNKSFVVTNSERPTLKELLKIFEEVVGKKLNVNWGARGYRDREVMKPYCFGKSVPNWKQKFTLKEAISKSIIKGKK